MKKKKGIIRVGKQKHLDVEYADKLFKKAKEKQREPGATGKIADAFARWKSGTAMSQIGRELGLRRRELKQKFVKLAGSKDKFNALKEAGAGGKAFGGKRATGGRTKGSIVADDSKVPVLKSSDIKLVRTESIVKHLQLMRDGLEEQLQNDHKVTDSERMRLTTGFRNARRILKQEKAVGTWKGWKCEHYQGRYGTQVRLIAPDKKTYVSAGDMERADYIVTTDIGRARYKLEKEARAAKVDKKEKAILKQGKEALKRKRMARKQKRAKKSKAA